MTESGAAKGRKSSYVRVDSSPTNNLASENTDSVKNKLTLSLNLRGFNYLQNLFH